MERISESDVKLEEILYKQQGKVEVYKVKHYRTGEILCMKKIFVENVEAAEEKPSVEDASTSSESESNQ